MIRQVLGSSGPLCGKETSFKRLADFLRVPHIYAPPLGAPYGPRRSPTVGFYGGAFSYERGTPVPYILCS